MQPHLNRRLCSCLLLLALIAITPLHASDPLPPLNLTAGFILHEVPIPQGRLACRRRPGPGPTLVLIPGTFSDSRNFAWTVPHIDPAFDLVLFENRGLGNSWPPPTDPSIEQCARDVVTLADALKIDSFYVGGHSLGGMISIELAKQIPTRLRGVISIEGWTNAQAAADAFQSDMKSTQTPAQAELLKQYRADVLKQWTPEQIKLFGSIWRQWDGSEILRTTNVPILELYGDRARPRPPREKLGLPDREQIRLVWFAGASHSLLIERPREVAHTINEFIHSVETPSK